jgi:hypothetical protein
VVNWATTPQPTEEVQWLFQVLFSPIGVKYQLDVITLLL